MPQVKLILIVVALVLGWVVALKAPGPAQGVEKREGGSVRGDGAGRAVGQPAFAEAPAFAKASAGESAGKQRYLALGDSYTIGESVDPEERYPVQVRRLLAENDHLAVGDPEIIAVTGWTTGNLLEALEAMKPEKGDREAGANPKSAYDMVSVLIGVNNQYQGRSQEEYREQFEELLQQCIRLSGNRPAHVLVLSIPDYSVTPFGRMRGRDTTMIAAQIDSLNRINAELARVYKVSYVDVTAESRKAAADPSLIAADSLHFSGKEYQVWAKLMEPIMLSVCRRSCHP
jgi:lysophospholipase L1-like esterase